MNRFESLPEVDALAVQRDEDQLAAIGSRLPAGPSEGVHALLWALTADVDEGLETLLAEPLPQESEPAEVIDLVEAGRRRAARTVTVVLLAAGLAWVSGMAAAVTGDPFSPYRSVISSVTGGDERPTPAQTAENTAVQRQIEALEAAIAAGQLDRARDAIDLLRARLRGGVNGNGPSATEQATKRATKQLALLEAELARAAAKEARTAEREAAKAAKKAEKAEKAKQPNPNAARPTNSNARPTKTGSADVEKSERKADKG